MLKPQNPNEHPRPRLVRRGAGERSNATVSRAGRIHHGLLIAGVFLLPLVALSPSGSALYVNPCLGLVDVKSAMDVCDGDLIETNLCDHVPTPRADPVRIANMPCRHGPPPPCDPTAITPSLEICGIDPQEPIPQVTTNAETWAARIPGYAYERLLDPLAPAPLFNLKTVWSDVVTYAEPFTVGWLLEHAGGPLPVDISISPAATPVMDVTGENVTSCSVNKVTIVGEGTDPSGKTDRQNARLYPDVWVAVPQVNASIQNRVLVLVEGSAGSAAGTDGWKPLTCLIQVPVVATDGLGTEGVAKKFSDILNATVKALPPATITIPMGTITFDETPDGDVHSTVQTVPAAIPVRGLTENITVKMQAIITWIAADDDWNSGDYVEYIFTGDGQRLADKLQGGQSEPKSHEYVIQDEATLGLCVSAFLMDEDFNKDDVYDAATPICTDVTYHNEAPDSELPIPCQRVANEFLAGRAPAPTDFTECQVTAMTASAAWGIQGSKDAIAYPLTSDGILVGVYVIPRLQDLA